MTDNPNAPALDVQGHRGCRGLLPENTIPAFLKAIDLGVHTLELDVVISRDHKVIISHEPWMSHLICTRPNGQSIDSEKEKIHNIYAMDYEQIKLYDCGCVGHPTFKNQIKTNAHKPKLSMLFDIAEAYTTANHLNRVAYNIEMKVVDKHIGIFHPDRKRFVDLVVHEIEKYGLQSQVSLQCFDIKTLQYLHTTYPCYKIVLLVENLEGYLTNIKKLGFVPDIYSPYYLFVNEDLISYANKNGMQVIPWTVNKVSDMALLIELGVHGIITDYPDRLISLLKTYK